jgi:hypothetical protein
VYGRASILGVPSYGKTQEHKSERAFGHRKRPERKKKNSKT